MEEQLAAITEVPSRAQEFSRLSDQLNYLTNQFHLDQHINGLDLKLIESSLHMKQEKTSNNNYEKGIIL